MQNRESTWVTLMDTCAGMLMDLREDTVWFRGIRKDKCYKNVFLRNYYVCEVRGLRERKRRR